MHWDIMRVQWGEITKHRILLLVHVFSFVLYVPLGSWTCVIIHCGTINIDH